MFTFAVSFVLFFVLCPIRCFALFERLIHNSTSPHRRHDRTLSKEDYASMIGGELPFLEHELNQQLLNKLKVATPAADSVTWLSPVQRTV